MSCRALKPNQSDSIFINLLSIKFMKNKSIINKILRKMRSKKSSKYALKNGVQLDSGLIAPFYFYLFILEYVSQMMPILQDYTVYRSADLLEFWSELNSTEARMAELAIAEQIRQGALSLCAATLGVNGSTVFIKLPK